MGLIRFFASGAAAIAMLAAAVSHAPAGAQEAGFLGNREYKICLGLAAREPEQAFEHSLRWQDSGGGEAALHCSAIALINLSATMRSGRGTRLEKRCPRKSMPDDTPPNPWSPKSWPMPGIAWQQAWRIWTKRWRYKTARLELSEANNPDILTDRAVTFFSAGTNTGKQSTI